MSRPSTQITLADCRRLHHLVAANVPVNEMARQLGRHRSTIYREIKRNTFHDPLNLPGAFVPMARDHDYALDVRYPNVQGLRTGYLRSSSMAS